MLEARRATLCHMSSLASRVREATEAAKQEGHSVASIASICGISPQAVYQWLDGRTKSIDGANLAELAAISGYNPLWIAKGRGEKCDSRAIRQAIKIMRQMTPDRQVDAVKIITPLAEPDNGNKATG